MPARHYAQILDASDPDQSQDDDFRLDTAPPEVLRGSFRLWYIPRDDSSYGFTRYLLSVQTATDRLAFVVAPSGGDAAIAVLVDGDVYVACGPAVFDAGDEIELLFDGPEGTITLTTPTSQTVVSGASWNVAGSQLRLGGNVVGGDLARGYVSLPYAVPGAVLPEPEVPGEITGLDFSNPDNSGYLPLL